MPRRQKAEKESSLKGGTSGRRLYSEGLYFSNFFLHKFPRRYATRKLQDYLCDIVRAPKVTEELATPRYRV